MKKIFGQTNISWKNLIIFSILIGISVGLINRIPFLYNTSFRDIAIYLEMWIILAIFIIINCKSWKEAVSKCFVFFLISQPLIYLSEILIDTLVNKANFKDIFILYFRNYYIGGGWFFLTLLTIPGSFIAYQIKKNNVLAALILSVATFYLSFTGTGVLLNTLNNHFPYHILNGMICIFMSFKLIFLILEKKKERIISIIITIIGIIIGLLNFYSANSKPIIANEDISFDENTKIVDCKVLDDNIAKVIISEDLNYVTIYSSKKIGTTEIILNDIEGNKYEYIIESTSKNFKITKK